MLEQKIEIMLQDLPVFLKKEVLDYVEYLSYKYSRSKKSEPKKRFTFDWEGGLAGYESQMTSVDLQHKASEWR